ncbi:MAG TPA: PHP domain-containing protein [Anaerolineales bacterium]|nr:PHP domain-containing protein [Anaerolineales bacterium]
MNLEGKYYQGLKWGTSIAGFSNDLDPQEIEQIETEGAVTDVEPEPSPGMMRIDLHCHSEASWDSSSPLAEIAKRCVEKEITVQAITDHNCIWGAQELQQYVRDQSIPLTIIVGEEISTSHGELIGLFLTKKVEEGLSPEETVREIKEQGGLVLLPHGFDPLKRWHLKVEAREKIRSSIDIVETFNSRISRPYWNRAAMKWAEEHGVVMSAGSDAHTVADVGNAWVEVPARAIHSPQNLLAALQEGTPMGVWTHPVIAFLYKMVDRTRRMLDRWIIRKS